MKITTYIREASAIDIPLIRAIADVSFRRTYAEILSPEQLDYMMEWMYSEKSLLDQMNGGHQFFLACESSDAGATVDDKAIGYVSVERQDEKTFHLQKIYILPEYQGNGIGEKLFAKVREYALSLSPSGCTVELNVNRCNKAYDFYVKMGMRKVREGDFPIGGGFYMNDYIMAIDL